MPMSRSDQPAYSTLRAFVAAARHESVREAADELGVTASAVSHQIRALEDWIGAAVFTRAPRQVRLTPLGRNLFRNLSHGFDAIEKATAAARDRAVDSVLRVSALPLFTSVWLIPRLERFEALCAKARTPISIEIDTSNALADFDDNKVDVAIRNVHRPAANLVSRKLLDLNAVPMCTPAVAGKLANLDDLTRATLIHISARPNGWRRWLEACGRTDLKTRMNLSFDTIPAALDATVAGRGVMLGIDPLVWDAPAAAKLVIPFDVKRISAGAYFLMYRRRDRTRRAVRMFSDWLAREVSADARRLSKISRNARLRRRQSDVEADC
jgi:LysR family transcriptional regulator, glycine cleavage system transcriptional activator